MWAIEEENRDWINTAFAAVPDACWIKVESGCVVDGEVETLCRMILMCMKREKERGLFRSCSTTLRY